MATASGAAVPPESPAHAITASFFWITLLTALAACGQFASNVYVPSLSVIAAEFGESASAVQLTIAVFLAGFAVAQLAWGPLSDRFGRRPALMAGLVLFLIGTTICALAQSLTPLLIGRAVQAIGSSAGIVISRAITRDAFDGADLMRVMGMVAMAFSVVPAATPLLGGVATDLINWQSTFWLTLVLGAALTAVTVVRLPETNVRPLPRLDVAATLRGYGSVLATRTFTRYALPMALLFGALFAFFAGAPVLFIDHLHVTPSEFGLYPPFSASGFVMGTFIMRRLIGRKPMDFLCAIGLGISVLGVVVMAAAPALGVVNKFIYVFGMLMMVGGFGFYLPLGMTAAIEPFRELSGTASAAMGFLQMTCGATAAVIVSRFSGSLPALAFPLVMVSFVLAAVLTFAALTPRR